MLKYAHAQIMTRALAPTDASARELRRFAHRHHFDYQVRPGYLYVRSRAISSRCNDNFDEFPAEELEKSYASFVGKPVFVNHHNDDHKRARGVIIDAALHKDANRDGTKDYWVEVLMEVDALRFPKLAAEIMNGNIARTSMGCDVAFSVCSACGNKATTPAEYCHHIPASKGMTLYRTTASGHKVGDIIRETCYGLKFFENSLLVEPPADPTAYFLGVDTRGVDKTASKTANDQLGLFEEPSADRVDLYHHTNGDNAASIMRSRHFNPGYNEDPDNPGRVYFTNRPHQEGRDYGDVAVHVRMPRDLVQPEGDPFSSGEQFYTADPDQIRPEHIIGFRYPHKESRLTLAELMAEGVNQEGGELPAFPWDKAPKINLPMTQKGWDDPRRKTMYDAKGERDMKGPQPAGPYQHLIDKLPDYATQELTNPHGMGAADVGRTSVPPDTYPGDKKEQWARHRWDNVKWPSWTDHSDRPSTPTEIAASKRNIRNRWSKTWKRPLACDHPGCPPWEHEGDPRRPTAPTSASDITMPNGHPLDPFQQFLDGDGGGTTKEGAQQYPNPADHPWFKETGLSHEHILHHWDQATPEEKAQGARWYPDAHLVAKSIAKLDPRIKSDKEAAHKGGGVLSAYSPQQGWWANQHNAARSFQEQRAIGKGEGIMVMASHANAAQKIMDGMPHQEALKGPKTQDFAHLIEHGGNDEHGNPSQRVVVDRHALSVAAGRRLNADDVKGFPSQNRHYYEHAAEHYRRAAAVASDREGRTIPPHEMQATTWLVRQRLNATEDTSAGQKGRNTVQRNQRKVWQDTSREHSPELHESDPPNSHVAKLAYGEQKAPADVDTLREDACPVCGDRDTFDGATCQVCGYVAPPKMFQDPDLEKARQMDLRKDIADFQDPANPMAGQGGPDGQPIGGGPMDPSVLDAGGNPINPDAADPNAQPGSLPGEVQAEVQPGGDPMDPAALGPDGQPLDPQGDPNELGAPVDPAMLGPDGQPLQQPGQQMMVGPNGEPIGPQALPAGATTNDGKPFTPGPNMPMGPGEPEQPEGPEAPLDPSEMGSEGQIPTDAPGDGQIPNPDAGQGVPGTPGDGVPDLQCPACGFTADATNPVSVDMDTSILPPSGEATPDGVQAGDVCPNCGAGQLMSPAEATGQVPVPVPV